MPLSHRVTCYCHMLGTYVVLGHIRDTIILATTDRWLSSGWQLMELLVLCSGHNIKNWAEIYYFHKGWVVCFRPQSSS